MYSLLEGQLLIERDTALHRAETAEAQLRTAGVELTAWKSVAEPLLEMLQRGVSASGHLVACEQPNGLSSQGGDKCGWLVCAAVREALAAYDSLMKEEK